MSFLMRAGYVRRIRFRLRASVEFSAFCLLLALNTPAAPMLRVANDSSSGADLLRNGNFEEASGTKALGWQPAPKSYTLAPTQGREGSQAIRCDNSDDQAWSGVSQALTLNRTNTAPLVVHGWSRAENVSGTVDNDYSLYVDLVYQDGTSLWGQTANFRTGTHDWQERQVIILPQKPVRSLTINCLLRHHSGTALFDNISVREMKANDGAFLFQGVPVSPVPNSDKVDKTTTPWKTQDGLELGLRDTSVATLKIAGADLAISAPSGFMVRDVAKNSDFCGSASGECAELGLRIQAEIKAESDHLVVEGRLSDTTGKDRAVTLVFALPLNATGWHWADDIHRNRVISGTEDYSNLVAIRCGATGAMSIYPLAAINSEKAGLALALDMGRPAQYRLGYHSGTKQLYLAYDFGLVPETRHFPNSADFRFVIFRFDPRWGFRSAWAKLMTIFPDYFEVRSRDQGLWMPFTDISTVKDWQDFGFKYHEGNNNVAWDDAHNILSFRYTEPMTWWMPMSNGIPRTIPEALRERDRLALTGKRTNRDLARISSIAAMYDETGQPALLFKNEPWCNGAVWSLNPNPELHEERKESGTSPEPEPSLNAATVQWNEAIAQRLYGASNTVQLDGEYLDSLEGYVTADLNFRRDHFRDTSVPLTFATDTHEPALFKGLAVFEFTRWIGQEVHRLGKLMFANGVPYRFTYLCPWLDVLGTETDWVQQGKYHPTSDTQMILWRTLSGAKPYLLLMNTDYDVFDSAMVERYFQRSLFYGMFPGMFSHNAAENPYWQNPKWYNRDRPLFKKYLPLIKAVAEAGWQPLTGAGCDNDRILVERFGPGSTGAIYFTALNETESSQQGTFHLDTSAFAETNSYGATEMLSDQAIGQVASWKFSLAPQEVKLFRLTK